MNRNLTELYPCKTCGHPNYKHDGNEQSNEDESCNHYDIIKQHSSLFKRLYTAHDQYQQYCGCEKFQPDNLKYLELKANG